MEKVYFRDNKKMKILEVLPVIKNLLENSKEEYFNKETVDLMRRKFVECYTNLEEATEPKLTLELARVYKENGIEFDEEKLKMSCLKNGIYMQQVFQSLPQEHLNVYNKSKQYFLNMYVYDCIYEYLDGNLLKTIISELFKMFFEIRVKLSITIKVTSERIDKIFENESIKNKETFFVQQLQTWATYHEIIPFMEYKIVEREEDETKKDILLNINLLKALPKGY